MRRVFITGAVSGLLFLGLAGNAFADVLVNAVPKHVSTCMKVGVWYQSFSGGPRWAVIKIFRYGSARAFWIKHTSASSSHWKFWNVCPGDGHYIVRYETANGNIAFYTHVG